MRNIRYQPIVTSPQPSGRSTHSFVLGCNITRIQLSDDRLKNINKNIMKDNRIIIMEIQEQDGKEKTHTQVNVYIYAPVNAKERTPWMNELKRTLEVIREKVTQEITVAGDFNYVTNPKLDKIGGIKKEKRQNREVINIERTWAEQWGIEDLWRIQNPEEFGFTCRSQGPMGTVYTRIEPPLW